MCKLLIITKDAIALEILVAGLFYRPDHGLQTGLKFYRPMQLLTKCNTKLLLKLSLMENVS